MKHAFYSVLCAALIGCVTCAHAGGNCACSERTNAPAPCPAKPRCPAICATKSPSMFQQYSDWFACWPATPQSCRDAANPQSAAQPAAQADAGALPEAVPQAIAEPYVQAAPQSAPQPDTATVDTQAVPPPALPEERGNK